MQQESINKYYSQGKKRISNNSIKDSFKETDKDNKINEGLNKRSRSKKNKNNEEMTTEEKLKAFDLDMTYGPSKGITRTKRYENALKFGLKPPKEIKDLLDNNKENGTLEISYFDKFI